MDVSLEQTGPTLEGIKTGSVAEHVKYTPKTTGTAATLTYEFTAENDKEVSMYIPTEYPRECSLTVNGMNKGTYFANETHRIVSIGNFKEGQKVTVKLEMKDSDLYISSDKTPYFYYFDEEVFKEVMPQLRGSEFNITEWTEDRLYGNINVSEGDELIFTSIPYDKGWKVLCDGEEVETFEILDSLIAVRLTPGSHTLEFKYRPACAVWGSVISIFGVVIFATLCVVDVKCPKLFRISKKKKEYGEV